MARVALVKVFAGLNMCVAQLAGELLRAGHDAHMYLYKEAQMRRPEERGDMLGGSPMVMADG
ncbi:MAG TPA: hypothetical protein VIM96_02905 [Pseudomonadales bacterium]